MTASNKTSDKPAPQDALHPHNFSDLSLTQSLTITAMLSALALALSWLETLIPFLPSLPGVKLGLANLVVIFALYRLNRCSALLLNATRILLSGFLFSGVFGILYSIAGAAASFLIMVLLLHWNHKRTARGKAELFSIYGISMTGGVFHNLGQLLVALMLLSNLNLIYYLPVMILSGIAAGILNGVIAALLLQRLPSR